MKTTDTEKTLFVVNRAQAAIYQMEMKGQMSDGRWENSSPTNHWHTPCEAKVVVRPEKIGRNFSHMRGYNFGERELFEIVNERMLRFAQTAIAFPEVSIQTLGDIHWVIDSPDEKKYYGQKLDEVLGVSFKIFEQKLVETNYTTKQLQADCSKLTTCFRTQL